MRQEAVRSRFQGALLGTFAGDALGMPLEGMTPQAIAHRYGVVRDLLPARLGRGTYTDDTEMTIAVAESLVACRGFDGPHMAGRFLHTAERRRGYGRGTLEALQRLAAGVPWDQAGAGTFGSGSFGNAGATRVAPIALLYHSNLAAVADLARASSEITHAHPLGRGGAAVQAVAIALALCAGLEPPAGARPELFIETIEHRLLPQEALYREGLEKVVMMLERCPPLPLEASDHDRAGQAARVAAVLGNDSRAFTSVPAALYSFLAYAHSFELAVTTAVALGGDTDTIAAMTGALAGAYHGVGAIPERWRRSLESGPRGRDYVAGLADDLFLLWLERYADVC
ncbi:MAG: ADP-ribosylglycohydrolase family protein [Thermoleophilia bacterium]|nr:ADP-ribosylglycohydrolase family protein [Thermoleophilia bacterium]